MAHREESKGRADRLWRATEHLFPRLLSRRPGHPNVMRHEAVMEMHSVAGPAAERQGEEENQRGISAAGVSAKVKTEGGDPQAVPSTPEPPLLPLPLSGSLTYKRWVLRWLWGEIAGNYIQMEHYLGVLQRQSLQGQYVLLQIILSLSTAVEVDAEVFQRKLQPLNEGGACLKAVLVFCRQLLVACMAEVELCRTRVEGRRALRQPEQ